MRNLNKKKVLVTAGPTWVPIDKVRVITNVFSGKLGYLVAKKAVQKGAKVTLLLGPGGIFFDKSLHRNLKVIRFKYFVELYNLIKEMVKLKKFDIVIHSAAVADYAPISFKKKIKSGKAKLTLELKPTLKIVDQIKKWNPDIFLVKFKLEVGVTKNKLINSAYNSMQESNADLIVANEFSETQRESHKAYIIDKQKKIIETKGKENIASKLIEKIGLEINYV